MPTRQLRAERDRLDDALNQAPRDRCHEADRAAKRHAEREQHVHELKATAVEGPELATAVKRADQAGEQARQLRQHQQQRAAWLETHADLVAEQRVVRRELGWRHRADGRALELDPPAELVAAFGTMPEDRKGRAAWRAAVGQVDGYRRGYGIEQAKPAKHEGGSERDEPAGVAPVEDRGTRPTSDRTQRERRPARHDRRADRVAELLGPQPTEDLRQRRAWQAARTTVERFRERIHGRDDRERDAG
jgi:hypothetical protein